MKNVINFYYNLYPEKLYKNNNTYRFIFNNNIYYVIQYNYELKALEESFKLCNILNYYKIYCHQIIPNNLNQLYTIYNNNKYVMLKVYNYFEDKVNLNYLNYYQQYTSNIELENIVMPKNWRNNWIEKVDYFEYEIENFRNQFRLINYSSSYFIGLAENSIQLLMNVNYNKYCVSHYRIKNNYTLFDYYNPLEFIIDNRFRDVTEYFKQDFFYNNNISELYDYINNIYSYDEAILFLSRMIFPTYYFDLCEDIFYKNKEENNLNIILEKTSKFEIILSNIQEILVLKFNIPFIEWLKKS